MLAGYAVPITGHEGYGNLTGYPPQDLSPGVLWSQRQRADGARIPQSPGHAYVDLILVVKLVRATGSADGVDVYYNTRVGHYQLHMSNGLTLITIGSNQQCAPERTEALVIRRHPVNIHRQPKPRSGWFRSLPD